MTDEDYINLAIIEAKKSVEQQGAPIGAIMVKDGKVFAAGHSLVWPKKDPSFHAETDCIKNACKALNSIDLSGCTLYSTLESCSMCLACGAWANLTNYVFGAFKEDIEPNPYEIKDYHAIEHAKNLVNAKGEPLNVKGGILRSECANLMKNIKYWTPV